MLLQMALFHSFLGMSSIPLYICTMYSLFNHLLMDIFFCELKHFHLFFLFKANYSKRVSPHQLHLARTQKQAEEQESFTVEKKGGFMYALAGGYQPGEAIGEKGGQGTLVG